MKKVTYSLIVIIILLILVVFIWPYVMGTALRSQIFEMNKNGLPNNTQLKIVSYHMGWLTSSMNLEISTPLSSIKNPEKNRRITFNMKLNVVNGPIAKLDHALTDKSWGWGRGVASGIITFVHPSTKSFPQLVALQRPVQFEAWVHWSGKISAFARLPAGDFFVDKKDGVRVTTGDITESATANRIFTQIVSNITASNIHIKQEKSGEAYVSAVTLHNNIKKGIQGLWYGRQKITIPQVSIVEKNKNLGQVQNIILSSSNQLDKNKNMTVVMLASIDKLSTLGQEAIGPFKLDLNMSNFQPKAMKALQDKIQTLAPTLNAKPNPAWSREKQDQFAKKQFGKILSSIQPALVTVLTGVNVKLNTLELNTSLGKVQMVGQLVLPDQINGAVTNPSALFNLALGSQGMLHASLSRPLILTGAALVASHFNSSPESLLEKLLKKGLLKQTGNNYSATVAYKKQNITLNGKALPKVIQSLKEVGIIPTPKPAPKPIASPNTNKVVKQKAGKNASTKTPNKTTV